MNLEFDGRRRQSLRGSHPVDSQAIKPKANGQGITTGLLQPLDWQGQARCTEYDPEIFFPPRGGTGKAARAVCAGCEVRLNCLEKALNNNEQFGIWGGTSERERRRIRKERARRQLKKAS